MSIPIPKQLTLSKTMRCHRHHYLLTWIEMNRTTNTGNDLVQLPSFPGSSIWMPKQSSCLSWGCQSRNVYDVFVIWVHKLKAIDEHISYKIDAENMHKHDRPRRENLIGANWLVRVCLISHWLPIALEWIKQMFMSNWKAKGSSRIPCKFGLSS